MYYNFPRHLQIFKNFISNRFLQLLGEEFLWLTSSWSFSASEQPTDNVERPLSGYIPILECFLELGVFSVWEMFWFFWGGKGVWVSCLDGFGIFWGSFWCCSVGSFYFQADKKKLKLLTSFFFFLPQHPTGLFSLYYTAFAQLLLLWPMRTEPACA